MKKIFVKSLLTLGILCVGLLGTGAAVFADYPPQHSINSVIKPFDYPPQH